MSASGGNETALLGSFARKQTEELKRANRLWTSDSLFLRTWLAVPVVEAVPAVGGASASGGRDTNGEDRAGPEDTPLQSDESIADFLGRIDNSIAKSRSQLRQLSHTRFEDGSVEEPTAGVAARDSAPAPVVMTRQVKHSLQRHERDHEEIFQL
ncbi:uncharacterized protein [Dermacentor andersoni]|uniref:uncharacterized protein isoform X2 n=1 Tax=Dermacentor andersoni TaxID=34620 RepID=UPI002415A185|nr:lysM and putative peptidoglycan-binding domain-containing protein 1-like isoform X2 [Dermacentor andersoni]